VCDFGFYLPPWCRPYFLVPRVAAALRGCRLLGLVSDSLVFCVMAALWRPPEVANQGSSADISQPFRGYGVLPAHPCVVKNTFLTFLHVVGEDPSESFDVPTSPRRPMSEPPNLRQKEPDSLWHAEGLPTDQDWLQQEEQITRWAGNEDHDELNDMDLRVMRGSCVLDDNCTSSTCGSTCTGSRQYSSGSDNPSSSYAGTCAGSQQYSSGGDRSGSDRRHWQGINETWRCPPPSSTCDVESSTSTLDVPCDDIEKETGSVSESTESTGEQTPGCQAGGAMAGTLPMQVVGRDCTVRRRSRTDPMPWDDVVVTVMVRQIPRQFSQLMFLKEVNARGFDGLFDFLYLPFDLKKGINVGYGFLSFIKAKHAQDFRREFDGLLLDKQMKTKGKPLRVHPANVQGNEANYQQFMQTHTGQKQDPQFSPLFLRPGGSLNPNSEWGHLVPIKDAPTTSAKTWVKQQQQQRQKQQQQPQQQQEQQQQQQPAACAAGAIATWCADTAAAARCRGDSSTGPVPADAAAGTGNRPSACHACGAPHGAKHNFCSACGAQVVNRVVLTPAPNLGFHEDVESSAKLFQELETEHHRLAKELAEAQAEGHRRAAGQAVHQQQQTQHYAAADTVCTAACAVRPIMLRGLLYPEGM